MAPKASDIFPAAVLVFSITNVVAFICYYSKILTTPFKYNYYPPGIQRMYVNAEPFLR